jgi:AcrR family transcriptional regulator
MGKSVRRSLGPGDWAAAAFDALARGGVDAVAVEPIATTLGTTKGSFYWHFQNRDALVEAALDLWESTLTDAVIQNLEREPNPAMRLKKLLGASFDMTARDAAAEVTLHAHRETPAVRQRVRKVTKRRIAYMAAQLERLGWRTTEANDRAVLLYYLYIGSLQTPHVLPHLSESAERRLQVERVFDGLAAHD